MGIIEDIDYISSIKDKLSRTNIAVHPELLKLLYTDYLQEDDEEQKIQAAAFLEELTRWGAPQIVTADRPLLPVPAPEDCVGDIIIGDVLSYDLEPTKFAIPIHELNQGQILIGSRSGGGKTTIVLSILAQLLEKDQPFLVADYKRDFRGLIKSYPQLIILNRHNLRINLLKPPPQVSINEFKQLFIRIFSHVEGIWSGSSQFLLQHLDQVYAEKNEDATFRDLYESLKIGSPNLRRMQDYWSAVYTRIYGIHSKLGDIVESRETLDLEALLTKPVIVELDGFGFEEQNLLILFFFYWIYAYRKAHRHRGLARHWLIIDEAKRVFPASEQYSSTTREYSHVSPSDLIVDEIRDFSEILLISDNEISKLSDSIIAQSYVKIIGNLAGRDLNIIAEAMNLTEDEKRCIPLLKRGEWLVKLASRHTAPFLITTQDFPIDKDVPDAEIEQRMRPLLSNLIIKPTTSTPTRHQTNNQGIRVTSNEDSSPVIISNNAQSMLKDVYAHPFKGLTGRYKTLNLSGRHATAAKNELIENDLVKEVKEKLGRRRRPTTFLKLTDQAITMLSDQGYDTSLWRHTGHMGFRHQMITVLIGYAFRRAGYKTYIEKKLSFNKRVDVFTIVEGKTIAIEVETGIATNMQSKLDVLNEVDQLIIITNDDKNTHLLQASIPEHLRNRVNVFSVADYLDYLNANIIQKNNKQLSKNSINQNTFTNSRKKGGKKGK
jgi:hypothetical protein